MYIRKGDNVKILGGRDRGRTGTVLNVFPNESRVTVEGLNLMKKRVRPKKSGEKGQIVSIARPLPVSRVAIVCKNCGRATRIGSRVEGAIKVRYCKKCGMNN